MSSEEIRSILGGWEGSDGYIECSLYFGGVSVSLRGRLEPVAPEDGGADVVSVRTSDGDASLSVVLPFARSIRYAEAKDLPFGDLLSELPESARTAGTFALSFPPDERWADVIVLLRERPTEE